MRCSNCGTEFRDGVDICPTCGKSVSMGGSAYDQGYSNQGYTNQGYSYQDYANPGYVNPEDALPPEYKPISMWGYFGYELLFSIPCVGFVILLVFAFGGTQNVNLKNFARSYFCFLIIAVVLVMLLAACSGAAAALSYSYY